MSPDLALLSDGLASPLGGWLAAGMAAGVAWRRQVRLAGASRLVAEAAHELRGPLCAARLAVGSLARAVPDGELVPRLSALDLELCRAGLAVEDLSAALSRDRARAGEEVAELVTLLRAAEPAWAVLAETHGARLSVCADGTAWVRGAPLRLAQALGNLVANACEHGGGHVEVRVEMHAFRVVVHVVDEGPGLPATLARRVADGSVAGGAGKRRRGHGLGIAARAAAEAGGRLELSTGSGAARWPSLVLARVEAGRGDVG